MIVNCPECELQVSDKALSCPHCGYPLKKTAYTSSTRRKNKRMRLPNGFGQISEIKNKNLRKPFRAMITVSKNENGRPICKLLKPEAYFATYNEAYEALIEYNRNPYDVEGFITVGEVYSQWISELEKRPKNQSKIKMYNNAWNYCSSIENIRIADIKPRHLKQCMNEGTHMVGKELRSPSPVIQSNMKTTFNLLFDYAVENSIVERNCARLFKLDEEVSHDAKQTSKEHIAYTDDEMLALWDKYKEVDYADIILIQCYSGLRPQEIGLIKMENVHLKEHYMVGGMKTEAGEMRIIPIHPKIMPLIKARYDEALEYNSGYLFNYTSGYKSGLRLTYTRYRMIVSRVVETLKLNPEHRAHDGRKHFVTIAKKYDVNEYAIKHIVGHTITDITERVYTERNPSWLYEELCKIPL